MVTNSQSSSMKYVYSHIRKKILSQLEFLSKQMLGAINRQNREQIAHLENAIAWLKEYSGSLGLSIPSIKYLGAEPYPQYAYDQQDPVVAVGESLLGELAALWRSTKESPDQAKNVVKTYHDLFGLLWLRGFRGDMFPEAELPDDLMPKYYLEYWQIKGSI